MSIPFSNTTLRIPRGFGNLLEGLAREVLRSQPKDIPTFAAMYFSALLKEREESGLDPAEWGAKLEDRFYNNHAFKEKEMETDGGSEPQQEAVQTVPEKITTDTPGHIEHELIQPVHISTISSANFHVFDDVPGVESLGDGEDICGAELGPSPVAPYGGIADVDICAEGLRTPGRMGISEGPEPKGDFNLSAAMGTPSPLPTPLPGPGQAIAARSPGSLLLDFQDDEAERMQNDVLGNAVEEAPLKMDTAGQMRGEVPERTEAVLDHGERQEEIVEPTDVEEAMKAELHLKGGVTSRNELQTSRNELQTGEEEISHLDSHLKTSEEEPPLGKASPGEDDPPLGSAREQGSMGENNGPEIIQNQETCTEDAVTMAEATNRDTLPETSGIANTPDEKADNHEDDSKEAMKRDAMVADAESDEICVGDVQPKSKEEVTIATEEQDTKESEELRQDVQSEEQELDRESDEQEQVKESDDLNQGAELEKQKQDAEMDEQEQGTESEDQNLDAELEEQILDAELEEQNLDAELEEQNLDAELEKQNLDAELEEQILDAELEEQNLDAELEGQKPGQDLEQQEQGTESEDQNQDAELEEQKQGQESGEQEVVKDSEEQNQGMELDEQVPAVIPEVSVDEGEHQEESEDLLKNMDDKNHDDGQELAQQEEEKVTSVSEDTGKKEECSQPQEEEDIMDIPLDDPEANKAAAKIQAGFRGHMTRKKMKDDKPQEENQQDQKD